jgi:hypothetical protein
MQKRDKISKAEIEPLLSYMNSIDVKLQEASGPTVAVELRMRLIGQFSQSVRDRVKELIKEWKTKNPKSKRKPPDKYWECDLCFLDKAIADVFQDSISSTECEALLEFRDLRNSLLHADFIALMTSLKIVPTGRQLLSINGNRNILPPEDIEEAIKSVDRNQGLKRVQQKACEVITILDKLLRTVST